MSDPSKIDASLSEEGEPVSPQEALAAIQASQSTVRQQTQPSSTAMFTAWGIAFVIAYTALYFGYDAAAQQPRARAMIVLIVCLVGAIAFTGIHIGRRVSGIRGTSSKVGAMYGWAWAISFVFASVIFGAVANAGASPLVMSILTNLVSLLIVSALYLAGGALFQEWRMFVLGVWFAVVGSIAAIVAPPNAYLVQAIAGGGGFLVAAAAAGVIQRWRSR